MWAAFIRSQADAILAMDFRRARILGTTAHPTHIWVTQVIRNLLMDLEDAGSLAQVRFLIRDRDAEYPALLDAFLNAAGIATVPTGVRMPRMNSIIERCVKTLRAELLDRNLVRNETHLWHVLREYERLTVRRLDRVGGVIHEYRHAA
jgi:putative transposase